MVGILVVTCIASSKVAPRPIFAFNLDGSITSPSKVSWRRGSKVVAVPSGVGLELDGVLSGLMVADHPAFAMHRAITVSTWIKATSYVDRGPGAQILFRGDDRSGADPYSFVIHPNGRVYFSIQDLGQNASNVNTELPLNQWTHIVASYDGERGILRMYKNGVLNTMETTKVVPLAKLDKTQAPGMGIGNVQWEKGGHNQPFHGILADLRLYNTLIEPKEIGFNPEGWNMPYIDRVPPANIQE